MARLKPLNALALCLAAAAAGAQDEEDLTLPPVIRETPGDARLEPPPEDRDDVLEAVVTSGQTDWRLPDLGTSLRDDEDERKPGQRIEVRFVPLYDPEKQNPDDNPLADVDVLRDVGFLRIFEIRFGGGTRN